MLKRRLAVVIVGGLLLPSNPGAAQSTTATTTRTFTNGRLGLTVVGTEIDLPPGQWNVASIAPANALEQVFLVPRPASDAAPLGRRVSMSETQRKLDSGRWGAQRFFWMCREYAVTHGGIGPNAFADLDPKKNLGIAELLTKSPWPEEAGPPIAGPFFFLVPATPIAGTLPQQAARASRTPLVLELRPYVDDGKHWVLFSDGATERVPVDSTLLAKYKVTVSGVRKDEPIRAADPKANVRHVLLGLFRDAAAPAATVTLTDTLTARRADVRWALAGGRADSDLISEWAWARAGAWLPLLDSGDASVLWTWVTRTAELYGRPGAKQPEILAGRDRSRTTSAFGVLGGRAAIRETLQMELLRSPAPSLAEPALVPISTLKGVEVKSLPFDSMLAGKPGGRIALADYIPADRFLAYFAKPSAVFPFLDQGGDFLAGAGSLFTGTAHDDDLKARYLRRLGLAEGAGRKFLESGAVTELALVTPDLFFIDGTDLTLVMRVRAPAAVAAALGALGIVQLNAQGITEKPTASGRSAYWARQGDLLCLSTSRAELNGILNLVSNTTAESLGRSAEFRYMLTELPVRAETRALVYLSDPFIRRMVGPAVKIGQLRRMRARAEMQMITAGALLFKLDGHRENPSLGTLIDLGYVPRSVTAANYRLQDDVSVGSPRWGTPADLVAIDTASIDAVTVAEAQAYKSYMEEYSQYWRQYFDPIAMRLDDAPGGALELSTFILPLVDSQLYNQLRGVIESRERGVALRVPAITPDPVFQLSLNLTDESWVSISGGWSEFFARYSGISPAIFDLLGPSVHIAVQDADPIIALGTADLLGAFGSATFGANIGFVAPIALSVLTRPTKIFVELQDPQRATDLLRQAVRRGVDADRGVAVQFRQVEGRDTWIYTLSVPGIVTVRLGLEIQNGFLVFNNMPWSRPITVQRVDPRPLNGAAMQVFPDAVREGLAGLFATQAEQDHGAALAGMASLLPLLQAISPTPEDATSLHAALFGSKPLHPKNGSWVWKNGKLESSLYGTATHWKMPLYTPDMGTFGLFDGATVLDLNMQLESGGLRAVCRWLWKDATPRR